MNLNHNITLEADILYVNHIPFFITVSRNLKFGTVEYLHNRNRSSILEAIENVVGLYNKRLFNVRTMLMDPEFESLELNLQNQVQITLNPAATQ